MALKKAKANLERIFDKNLHDLVRGIRNHKDNEAKYIAECIDEIKQELKQENISVKANAVNKLAYLQMLGYDISWAAFNVIEVMSSTKYTHKRLGYYTASQCFHDDTDVLMLTTNLIRKDLSAQNMYDAGVALSGLACFMNADLARDLANDIMTLMTSTKPYLRKKSVLIMYKVFLKFPDALRPAFSRLKEKLEDPDPGVQSAAVNVICELARKNPQNYLSLAPIFFKLMTSSSNNWVLIKIIKLFSALTPLEPRLGKKLIEPLTNLIHSTSAMSLLYECINTVIAVLVSISSGLPSHNASIQLCVQKLRILIEDSDQNLKYLGLLAMGRILKTHPKSVQTHKDLVLQCLDDKDESIRLRALDLLYGMVSKKNLMEIVKKLMIHMDKSEGSHYRDELLSKIIDICSQNNYQFVTNFEWYVTVLVELTRMEGTKHGRMIAAQMLDVAIRVPAIRPFSVTQMVLLLDNAHLLGSNPGRSGLGEVLYASAWICGEFAEHLEDPQAALDAMLRPKMGSLPGHIQSVFVQNIAKLFARLAAKLEEEENTDGIRELCGQLTEKLNTFMQSGDLEVQERASSVIQLLKYVLKLKEKGGSVGPELAVLFAGELNPVGLKAQKKVPLPEGLDLDAWINDAPSESSEEEEITDELFVNPEHRSLSNSNAPKREEPSEEELGKRRAQRKVETESNPFYIKGATKAASRDGTFVDDIPVAPIDLSVGLQITGFASSDKYLRESKIDEHNQKLRRKMKDKKSKKRGKKHAGQDEEEEEEVRPVHVVAIVNEEMPEGARESDGDDDDADPGDPHRALNINLDAPLRPEEALPVRTHRVALLKVANNEEDKEDKKKKKSKEKAKEKDKKGKKDKEDAKKDKKKKTKKSKSGASPSKESEGSSPQAKQPESQPVPEEKSQMDDIEFWLSQGDSPASPPAPAAPAAAPATSPPPAPEQKTPEKQSPATSSPKTDESKKKKKDKSVSKDKSSKKMRRKAGYEEAEGIATPSKEMFDVSVPEASPPPSHKLLGESSTLRLNYETKVDARHPHQVVIAVMFTNLTSSHIHGLEFNIIDSINTKLVRAMGSSAQDGVKVPFQLPPEVRNEGQFAFTAESIAMPQKFRGTVTYMVRTDSGSTHEKIDFRLEMPCSSYLVPVPIDSASFADLLASGELVEKSSAKFQPADASFQQSLRRLSTALHFSVVEQIENSCSLYARSIQGHHVALLVKQLTSGMVSVDGKGSERTILSNVVEECKGLLQ